VIEARVKRLIEDFTVLIRHALSMPAARRQLSCDPGMAAELVVTFSRGLAVMQRVYRNPRQLEKMSRNSAHAAARGEAPPRRLRGALPTLSPQG
jgi:hypothetical protein